MVSEPIRCLLGVQPRIRTCQLNRHIRKENPQRLAVACPAMVQGEKQRADLLVIQPLRVNSVDDNRLSGAPAPEKLLDQVVRADVHLPAVAGSVPAALGRSEEHTSELQ